MIAASAHAGLAAFVAAQQQAELDEDAVAIASDDSDGDVVPAAAKKRKTYVERLSDEAVEWAGAPCCVKLRCSDKYSTSLVRTIRKT